MAIHDPEWDLLTPKPTLLTCVTSWPRGPLDSQIPLSTLQSLLIGKDPDAGQD